MKYDLSVRSACHDGAGSVSTMSTRQKAGSQADRVRKAVDDDHPLTLAESRGPMRIWAGRVSARVSSFALGRDPKGRRRREDTKDTSKGGRASAEKTSPGDSASSSEHE